MSQSTEPTTLLIPLHVEYIKALDAKRTSLAYHLTTHLRMNAVYWGLAALEIMNHSDVLPRQDLVDFVKSCWDPQTGGFGPFPGHDPHILSTLSAIQILAMKDALDTLDRERVISYVLSRQLESGAFTGDEWGEEDTRFLYCSVSALSHLKALDRLDKEKVVNHVLKCENFDGGFGTGEGGESHAAQVWVCVAALTILNSLDRINKDRLGWWLCERQMDHGGLNGRPQKLEDVSELRSYVKVCYSWWVLSSLSILGKLHWIDGSKLQRFILSAQDPEGGGIADRPDNVTDVFHTLFGVAALSLLGENSLAPVDPVYCLPQTVIRRLGIGRDYKVVERR